MSNLFYLPHGKTLDYWYEKLSGFRYRRLFLVIKAFETIIFSIYNKSNKKTDATKSFTKVLSNEIPENPTLSIVIPAYLKSREDINKITALLDSIRHQSKKADYIIVIDDCSIIKYNYPPYCIVRNLSTNSGPAYARNVDKEIAKSLDCKIVAFTDVDCIVDHDWIKVIIESLKKNPEASILSGRTTSWGTSWPGIYHNISGTLNGRKFLDNQFLLYGVTANLAITSDVNNYINFNENFPNAAAEDVEFCFRANQMGFRIIFIESMLVQHNYGYKKNLISNMISFFFLFLKYAKGQCLLLKFIPEFYDYYSNTIEITEPFD